MEGKQPSLEQLSQSVAEYFKGQSLPRQVPQYFFSVLHGCNVTRTDREKKTSLQPALNFTSSTLSQSMCTLLVYSRARCLNVTTRSLDPFIRDSASSSPLLPSFIALFLLLLSISLKALVMAFFCYIGSFFALPASHVLWVIQKEKSKLGDMLHPNGPLNCLGQLFLNEGT